MKEEFVEYMRGLGMSDTLIETARNKYAQCVALASSEFDDLFVVDYVEVDGSRRFESIACFKIGCIVETFLARNRIEALSLSDRIDGVTLSYDDYDLITATSESRLHVELASGVIPSWGLRGTGLNCDKLLSVVNTYITPTAFPWAARGYQLPADGESHTLAAVSGNPGAR